MKSFERKMDRAKGRFNGAVNQAAGKISGDEVLELKGRMQTAQADLKEKTDVGEQISRLRQSAAKGKTDISEKIEEIQQSVAKKVNDSLGKHEQRKSK
ncbi:MAG: hypothetical protein ABFC31_05330 [Clostridiaceae bacterium]